MNDIKQKADRKRNPNNFTTNEKAGISLSRTQASQLIFKPHLSRGLLQRASRKALPGISRRISWACISKPDPARHSLAMHQAGSLAAPQPILQPLSAGISAQSLARIFSRISDSGSAAQIQPLYL
ncbi:hypothetical protein WMY93_034147 [Mugilogobius chulae]|uniref:Uncharacterized protein n=1 Tax=Mugilogobius chulae TaxID=88201 RepID=A0AAW0MI56_9GOBI